MLLRFSPQGKICAGSKFTKLVEFEGLSLSSSLRDWNYLPGIFCSTEKNTYSPERKLYEAAKRKDPIILPIQQKFALPLELGSRAPCTVSRAARR